MNFLTLIDYIGTFAFAISGIRLASAKRFDRDCPGFGICYSVRAICHQAE